jgi:hypothetical protein
MLLQDPVADSKVRRLLEEAYFDSGNQRLRERYGFLSEPDKRTALLEFANEQALKSKRWAAIVQDLRSAGFRS